MHSRLSARPITLMLLCAVALCACGEAEPDVDPRLRQAVAAARYMTGDRFLARSAFRATVDDDPRPSDLVGYLFSDFGVAEWPIAIDEFEREQLRAARIPALPDSVTLVPNRPDPAAGRQVVLRADDTAGVLFIEAYTRADTPPVLTFERRFGS